nr:PREDICTED: uncharacterized protein LOC662078 isoform X2 [Tribolium castaneum]|eukprot:XP_008191619.1 PREDICTED: uncharacterized protein LOC662078 isoform X2 [Tribolium castaneum]
MSTFSWIELFPTKLSFVIFLAYILLFVGQGILVTASQKADNQYDYNIITVVLLTEVLKLIVSTLLYCKDNSPKSLVNNIVENRIAIHLNTVLAIGAVMYAVYLYSQNPVSSKASSRQSDQIALIKSEQV